VKILAPDLNVFADDRIAMMGDGKNPHLLH
jgi:hypothetical protein